VRPYCASDQRFRFVVEHGPSIQRYRRSHPVGFDQGMRRYDASRARQEARAIERAELCAYYEGLAAEAREQAAADLSYAWTYTKEEIDRLCTTFDCWRGGEPLLTEIEAAYYEHDDLWMDDDLYNMEIEHEGWEKEQAWQDHEEGEEQLARIQFFAEAAEHDQIERFLETGRLIHEGVIDWHGLAEALDLDGGFLWGTGRGVTFWPARPLRTRRLHERRHERRQDR
jgi:hypothetical protein